MAERKYMPIQEFYDTGLLQEVNRQFFHPRGLALTVNVPETPEEEFSIKGIWDVREDPEGIFFDASENLAPQATYAEQLLEDHKETRLKNLGFIIQPVSVLPPKEDADG